MRNEKLAHHLIEPAMKTIIGALGEDHNRDGLLETPHRVAKAMLELTSGYQCQDPAGLLKTFDNDGTRDMVIVEGIPFHSLCEHHMLPFYGHAHIAYIPGDRIVGLSKFARLVDVFARRLQVQERLTDQIASTLSDALEAEGVMIVLQASHLCMSMRGVQRMGSKTTTCALRGTFQSNSDARQEALSHIHRHNK